MKTKEKHHTERFKELMERDPKVKNHDLMALTDEEIIFMAKEDFSTFSRRFPSECAWYMDSLDVVVDSPDDENSRDAQAYMDKILRKMGVI